MASLSPLLLPCLTALALAAASAAPALAQQSAEDEARAAIEASEAEGFPRLQDIPDGPTAKLDPVYWATLRAELAADRAALLAHPRATPAPATATADAEAFRADAAQTIEDTRTRY